MATIPASAILRSQLEDLIKEVKKMNSTQNELLATVNSISDKLEGVEANKCNPLALDHVSTEAQISSKDDSAKQIFRPHGYVTWSNKHDIIKTQKWVEVTNFRRYCDYIKTCQRIGEKFDDSSYSHVVNEVKRFPQGYLFMNVSNPRVATEILCATYKIFDEIDAELDVLNSLKNNMHTRSSFEQKCGLIWIKPPKN